MRITIDMTEDVASYIQDLLRADSAHGIFNPTIVALLADLNHAVEEANENEYEQHMQEQYEASLTPDPGDLDDDALHPVEIAELDELCASELASTHINVDAPMRKLVINDCYGGFGLSDEAMIELAARMGCSADDAYAVYDGRDNPHLVALVEEWGERANGDCACLKVVEIPADVNWRISEYDGAEHICETHRTWQ